MRLKMKSLSFCQFLERLLNALFAVRDIPVDVAKLVFADFDFELHNDDIAGRVLLLKVFDFVVGHHHTLY